MSTLDPSMVPMLEMFIYESSTLLEQLDEILLEAEKLKALKDESVNEIFRIMHTIKGSSAMMGIENMSHLSHSIEDMFFILREHPEKLNENVGIFDLVFQSSDFFKTELTLIQGDTYEPTNCDSLTTTIKNLVLVLSGKAPMEQPAPTEQNTTVSALDNTAYVLDKNDIIEIRVFFEDGCQMENIRSFMLLSSLTDFCGYLESVPAAPEKNSALSEEIIRNGLLIQFAPSSAYNDVHSAIENFLNIKSYEVITEKQPDPAPVVETQQAVATESGTPASANMEVAQNVPTPVVNTPASNSKNTKQSLISVNQSKLDQLMDIVGELVIAESMVASNQDLKGLQLDNFYKSTRQLRKLTDELQDIVMSIRMVPLSGVFMKMQRIVRDIAKKLDKKAQLVTFGEDTEVDKTINDTIADPFMHMVRNAIDHAIELPHERVALGKPETGTVTLSAQNVGGEIVINISDDGKGLDSTYLMQKAKKNNLLTKPESEYTEKEIFNMIMLPGFSTKEAVTEFSGRGVGMDVVCRNIEIVGGSISVESKKDIGTTFTIKIPLTLAIVDGMEISVGDTVFTLPITSIKQSFKVSDSTQILYDTDKSEMILVRGECYPIIRLHEIYGIENAKMDLFEGIVILIENEQKVACLFVDELIGEQQVVVKPFPTFLNKYNVKGNGLAGCTILGDGSISLILDANNLLKRGER